MKLQVSLSFHDRIASGGGVSLRVISSGVPTASAIGDLQRRDPRFQGRQAGFQGGQPCASAASWPGAGVGGEFL